MDNNQLKKRYGLFTAICMVVGIVIGSGIFFKSKDVLTAANGNALHSILAWLISGFVMAFTLSLDDFVISLFTSGASAQNLSVTIYSMTKKPITPEINALSTLMFGTVLLLLLVVNIRQVRDLDKQKERR